MAAAASSSSVKKHRDWLPLEADPELMSQYLHKLGADPSFSFSFSDVYGVDDEMLGMVPQPVSAVLLLYPITSASEAHRSEEKEKVILAPNGQKVNSSVYWMKQTTGNACGTVALTHTAMNLADKLGLADGSFFAKFLALTRNMSADERAEALDENQEVSEEHESVASAGVTSAQEAMNTNLHFIAFVPINGELYELDGRKAGPVNHGPTSEDRVLHDAVKVVKGFMNRDPQEVNFNMVALTPAQ